MPSLPPTGLPQDVVRPGTDDIVTSPGYHSPSKLYLAQRGSARVIKPAPTLADAQTGAQMLMRPFASFPWADEQQRGVVLLAALLAVIRQMFAMAPGVAISAPVASSGKTLASQVLAILATGSEVPVYTMPPNLDKQEKRLLGMFLGGRRAFILDNITSRFDSSALNAAMTSEFWESRILAQSKTTRVSTRVLILANGNNLSMAGDVSSRFLYLALAATSERPEDRTTAEFDVADLKEWTIRHRQGLVAAALMLIRAYLIECRRVGGVPPEVLERRQVPGSRFPAIEVLRNGLLWVGESDGFVGFLAAAGHDEQREDRVLMINAVAEALASGAGPSRALTAAQLIEKLFNKRDLLEHVLAQGRGPDRAIISPIRLGKWLNKNLVGGVYDGKKHCTRREHNHAVYWVEEV